MRRRCLQVRASSSATDRASSDSARCHTIKEGQ